MKILVIGRGVIGTLYGWALARGGATVEFLLRPGRAATLSDTLSLRVMDSRSGGAVVEDTFHPTYREHLENFHDFDLIILSVPHYSVRQAAMYLSRRVAGATVLIFNNFWEEPLSQVSDLPLDQCVWGFPAAGGGFSHDNLEGVLLKKLTLGTFDHPPTARHQVVAEMFRSAGFGIKEVGDFRGWLLLHFVQNGALHAAALEAGSHAALFSSARHRRNAIAIMKELIPVVRERGIDLGRHAGDLAVARLPTWLGGFALGVAWKASRVLKVMASSNNNQRDAAQTCVDLINYAVAKNLQTPRLDAAVRRAVASGTVQNIEIPSRPAVAGSRDR